MFIKCWRHTSVYLNTSALKMLDWRRVWACRTYESPGYHRLPQVSLKQDAVVREGRRGPLTAADRESAAQEDRKRSRLWNIDETVAFPCCGSEVHFLDVLQGGKKVPQYPLVSPAFEWGRIKCCLTEFTNRLVTFSRAQALRSQTSEETTGNGTGW